MEVVDFEADAIRNSRLLSAQVRRGAKPIVLVGDRSLRRVQKKGEWKIALQTDYKIHSPKKIGFPIQKKSVYAVKTNT